MIRSIRNAVALALSVALAGQASAQTNALTTNASAVITTAFVLQQNLPAIVAGGQVRRSLTIQNNNGDNATCWVYVGSNPTLGASLMLLPGQAYDRCYPLVPADAIYATCQHNADTMYVEYQ